MLELLYLFIALSDLRTGLCLAVCRRATQLFISSADLFLFRDFKPDRYLIGGESVLAKGPYPFLELHQIFWLEKANPRRDDMTRDRIFLTVYGRVPDVVYVHQYAFDFGWVNFWPPTLMISVRRPKMRI